MRVTRALLCVFILSVGASCGKQASRSTSLTTEAQRVSYALGLEIGASVKRLDTEIDLGALLQGIQDTLTGHRPLLTDAEAAQVREEFAAKYREAQAAKAREAADKNLAEGTAFLEQNRAKEGVTSTPSGLQYLVIRQGEGPRPTVRDRVRVHYRGTLLDGTEFDSSYRRGEPAVFEVGDVISGWVEALQLMPVGSTYRLFIPPHLAYGPRGAGPLIGPNATLIFEVELLGIEG